MGARSLGKWEWKFTRQFVELYYVANQSIVSVRRSYYYLKYHVCVFLSAEDICLVL